MSLMTALLLPALLAPAEAAPLPRADGYRGIWYMNQPSKDEYVTSQGYRSGPSSGTPSSRRSRRSTSPTGPAQKCGACPSA